MDEWPTRALGDLISLQRGYDLPTETRTAGTVPVVGSGGISGWHNEAREEGPGVVVGRAGASIGKPTLVKGPYWPLNTTLFVKDFKGNNPRWVYYFFEITDFTGFNSGGAQPMLNRNYIAGLQVPTPDASEQCAIADVLGALDDKVALNERLYNLADQLCAAEVQRASMASAQRQLREVLTLHYGKALPASERTPGDVVVYGSGGITGTHSRPLVDRPGVIVGRKGTVGAVYWASGPHFPIDTTYYVEPREPRTAEIIYYLLRSAPLAELNSDSAVPGLNRDEAYACQVNFPENGSIEPLSRNLRQRFSWMKAVREEMKALTATRDELLPLLMSGKIRVRDAEKVVEGVV